MFTPGVSSDGSSNGKVRNTLIATGPGVEASYDKIHLFDAFGFAESDTVDAGTDPVTFDDEGRVYISGVDVTSSIRDTRIDRMVPVVARHTPVREVMRERQRQLGSEGDVVIEGRDIGTVVAPTAKVKVYLVADQAERAKRRMADRPGIGRDALATDLKLRDRQDAERMQPAADAQEIDTTHLRVDEVVERIVAMVRERTAA